MNTGEVDKLLFSLLFDVRCHSRLLTCLSVRLADHAAQLCGHRSTRQIREGCENEVEDSFNELMNILNSNLHECEAFLQDTHSFKDEIINFDDEQIEILLEDTLYEMTIYDCASIFVEKFFK